MEKIIDCRGQACPLPVVNAKKAAEELNTGDVLTVLVDNEIAVQNLTRFAEHKGFAVSADKKAEKEYAVVMHISGAVAEETKEEVAPVEEVKEVEVDNKKVQQEEIVIKQIDLPNVYINEDVIVSKVKDENVIKKEKFKKYFDYIKIGHFNGKPLNNKDTNQRLYRINKLDNKWELVDITNKLW